MDSRFYHFLKYKVTRVTSAIFADNITKLMMSLSEIPWKMEFAREEDYNEFTAIWEEDILLDIDNIMFELDATFNLDSTLWQLDEDTFLKRLYILRMEFIKYSFKTEDLLLDSSLKMLCYAGIYYKSGVKNAPIWAFLEVYRLACVYYKPGRW